MAKQFLQVNFKYNGLFDELRRANLMAAKQVAQTSGLRWKIWLSNEEESEAAGLYLFDDEASVESYLTWRMPQWKSIPAISNISIKQFEVEKGLTEITHGPVK